MTMSWELSLAVRVTAKERAESQAFFMKPPVSSYFRERSFLVGGRRDEGGGDEGGSRRDL